MKKLSLCMIVKDEEKNLDNALKNSKIYADEIIIVDTGSKDKTKEIAYKYTPNVYDFEWVNDFSKARNFAFDKATCDYLMWLDGDDFILEESANNILKWKEGNDEVDVLMCPYVSSYNEDFTPTFQYLRERIVKNIPSLRFHDKVHEVIIPSGRIVNCDNIKIYHNRSNKKYTARNLMIYRQMIKEGEVLSPRSQFYYARELYFNNFIDEAIHEFSRFIFDGGGWKENNIEACLNLGKCYLIKKKYENALTALFGSFVYDNPRGEILCEIGNTYLLQEKYDKAIYWYKLALQSQSNIESGAFVNIDCYTFIPALQLCVCYDKLGDKVNALTYHELSKAFKPNDKSVLHNQIYFDNL